MKYKVGDEVLVKAKIIAGAIKYFRVEVEDYRFNVCEDNIVHVQGMTAEEAWEIAKKLFADYSNVELDEIFGKEWSFSKLMELTPQEAKSKIEAWKAGKEIKIGDEVVPKRSPNSDDCKFFVTKIADDMIEGFSGYNGDVFSRRDIAIYQKTGRHIDIEGLLNQIGVDE